MHLKTSPPKKNYPLSSFNKVDLFFYLKYTIISFTFNPAGE